MGLCDFWAKFPGERDGVQHCNKFRPTPHPDINITHIDRGNSIEKVNRNITIEMEKPIVPKMKLIPPEDITVDSPPPIVEKRVIIQKNMLSLLIRTSFAQI